jgi:hypothetical protein
MHEAAAVIPRERPETHEILRTQSTRGRREDCQTALLHSKPDRNHVFVSDRCERAYLLGSIPFGFLLVWLVRKEDIRTKGSGNIGATNVLRSGAKGLGVLTFVLDGAKGYAAVMVAELLARGKEPTTSAISPSWLDYSSSWAICFPSGCTSRAAKAWPLPLASSWRCACRRRSPRWHYGVRSWP